MDKIKEITYEKRYLYTSELLSDLDYYEFIECKDSVLYNNAINFRNSLLGSDDFTYVILGAQPLEVISHKIEEQFLYGYEGGNAESSIYEMDGKRICFTKSLQVSKNFVEQFPVEISEGKFFSDEDFHYENGKQMPIILGVDYKAYFTVGDVIEANYLMEDINFKIIGFFDNDSFFYSNLDSEPISCNRYIVMPAFSDAPDSEFSRRMVLQHITGVIISTESCEIIQDKIQKLLLDNGLAGWTISVFDPTTQNESVDISEVLEQYSSMTDEVADHFRILIWLLVVGETIVLCMLLCGIVREQFHDYGIFLLCGASMKNIILQSTSVGALIIGLGDFFAILIWLCKQVDIHVILLLQIVPILTLGLMVFICNAYLAKMNISSIIGGKE